MQNALNQGYSDWQKPPPETREQKIARQVRNMSATAQRKFFANEWASTSKDGGLASYRRKRGLSQEDFEHISGVNLRTLQRIENGNDLPQHATIDKILGSINEIEVCIAIVRGEIMRDQVNPETLDWWDRVGFSPQVFVQSWPQLKYDGKKVDA
jgi:transcriptional regulator with XRE-family HTH domain